MYSRSPHTRPLNGQATRPAAAMLSSFSYSQTTVRLWQEDQASDPQGAAIRLYFGSLPLSGLDRVIRIDERTTELACAIRTFRQLAKLTLKLFGGFDGRLFFRVGIHSGTRTETRTGNSMCEADGADEMCRRILVRLKGSRAGA